MPNYSLSLKILSIYAEFDCFVLEELEEVTFINFY